MRYKDEKEIAEVVRTFEDATISRDAWKHAEHLTVALHYVSLHDMDTAAAKMREGIFKLLAAFEVDLTKEMPRNCSKKTTPITNASSVGTTNVRNNRSPKVTTCHEPRNPSNKSSFLHMRLRIEGASMVVMIINSINMIVYPSGEKIH